MKNILLAALCSFIFYANGCLEACTGLKLKASDGAAVHGRTLEFGISLPVSIAVIPKGYAFTSDVPKGIAYTSKYAAVGAYCFDKIALLDGVNEEGLSVGTFYFPGFAEYTETTEKNAARSLTPIEFPNWILTQFQSLNEVKTALKDIVISPFVYADWGNTAPPFHYIVYDKSGESLVIEPIQGKLVVYDNPLGVLTNSPTFDWQMTNLRNYIHLSPNNAPPLKWGGLTLEPFGQGSGMLGLPGDFTPPSRFVRATAFAFTAMPVKNAEEGIFKVFHLLNQFDIPVGIVRQKEGDVVHTDYTIATIARDPMALKYYFHTYDDPTIRLVDLKSFDRNAKEVLVISTAGWPSYVDLSRQLTPLKK